MDKTFRVREAAEFLGCSISKLNKLRCTGGGPTYIKIGALVLYREAALREFISKSERQSTSQRAAA